MIKNLIDIAEFLIEVLVPEFFQDMTLELSDDDVRHSNGGVIHDLESNK